MYKRGSKPETFYGVLRYKTKNGVLRYVNKAQFTNDDKRYRPAVYKRNDHADT